MKLFEVYYMENNDDVSYLTVGNDDDTEDFISEREYNKRNDWNCLYYLHAREINEVDGHRIIVEEQKMSEKRCCGTCAYHQFENITDGWVCVNDKSEYLSDWTDYGHSCDCWTGKDEE